MGCDIHLTLARVTALPAGESVDEKNAIRVIGFNDGALMFSQLEFEVVDYRDQDVPSRNYDLFAWLAGIRGDLAPMVPVSKLKEVTRAFMDWCKNQYYKLQEDQMRKSDNGTPGYYFGYRADNWIDEFVSGDHSFVLYPIVALTGFNYDQQVVVQAKDPYENEADYLERQAEYAGKTYRDIFGNAWFRFIARVTEEKWDLVIFSFDS